METKLMLILVVGFTQFLASLAMAVWYLLEWRSEEYRQDRRFWNSAVVVSFEE